MTLKEQIMHRIIYNRKWVKDLMLSERQIEIMQWIIDEYENTYVTSNILCADLHITLNNASMHLGNLCKKGYLERKEIESISGGIEYQYKPIQL